MRKMLPKFKEIFSIILDTEEFSVLEISGIVRNILKKIEEENIRQI